MTGQHHDAGKPWNLSEAGYPLFARYDLTATRKSWNRETIASGPVTMWRYAPVMPLRNPASIVTLGEGFTPLIRLNRFAEKLGCTDLWVKDESPNPTGSFKARGLSAAISMSKDLGISKVAIPSAGNAGSATAAYAAAAGIEAHIFMPADVPQANFVECKSYGAHVRLIEGLISDCAKLVAEGKEREGWFDLSTMKEPYRTEGNKTVGYELAEQFNWKLPDAILFPTGGGEALIGVWKAFAELETLGWIGARRPKMIAVQADGCQPIIRALEQGADRCEFWQNAFTVSSGLRVPKPLADLLILRTVRDSRGTGIAISDDESLEAGIEVAALDGIFPAPEAAACFAALKKLLEDGRLRHDERIVIHNTGSGLKYLEAYSTRFPRNLQLETDKLGGLITPR